MPRDRCLGAGDSGRHGIVADYKAARFSPLHASVLGTAWLTAYRALFTKSGVRAGDTLLIQGATGGMATALIQLGRAAGFEVWATSRTEAGRTLATALGAHRTFSSNETLPRKVRAVKAERVRNRCKSLTG